MRWEIEHDIGQFIGDMNVVKAFKKTQEAGGVTYVVYTGEVGGVLFVGPGNVVGYRLERAGQPKKPSRLSGARPARRETIRRREPGGWPPARSRPRRP